MRVERMEAVDWAYPATWKLRAYGMCTLSSRKEFMEKWNWAEACR